MQPLEQIPAFAGLELPARALPSEQLTHGGGQLLAAEPGVAGDELCDEAQLLGAEASSSDHDRLSWCVGR
jgi:hypothetical protein